MAIKKYEEFLKQDKLNEELGLKDVGIAAAFMINTLFGGNAANAQKASDDQLKAKVVAMSQNQDLIDKLEDKGVVNAAELLKNNADDLVKKMKHGKFAVKTLNNKTEKDAVRLAKKGWAISEQQIQEVIDTVKKEAPQVNLVPIESIVINYDAGNAFEPGRFVLKQEVKKEISDTLTWCREQGIIITEVNIESSTDKQRVSPGLAPQLKKILGGKSFENDNNNLSQVRNDTMKSYVQSHFDNDSVPQFSQTVLFEKGKGELGAATPQDASARYVKITLYGVCCVDSDNAGKSDEDPSLKIINTFKLVKAEKSHTVKHKPPTFGGKVTHKTGKININNCNKMHKAFRGYYN